MTDVETAFTRAAADLDEMSVDWAVIGGLAVSARAAPLFTQDVDFQCPSPLMMRQNRVACTSGRTSRAARYQSGQ